MSFKAKFIAITLTAALAAPATGIAGEQFRREKDYVEFVQPWAEFWSDEEVVRNTTLAATESLKSLLIDINEKNIFPEQITSMAELEAMQAHDEAVGNMLTYLNEWTTKQRDLKGGEFTVFDSIPDAFIVFIGGRYAQKLGFTKGGSIQFGIVVAPQKVTRQNIKTGEIVGVDWTLSTTIIGWPTVDIGFEANAGQSPKKRWGIGLIWDLNDQFVAAKDFHGVGLAGSFTSEVRFLPTFFPTGANFKAGFLSKDPLNVTSDLFYATVARPIGQTALKTGASLGGHINFTGVLSFEDMMGSLGRALAGFKKGLLAENEKAMRDFVEEYSNIEIPVEKERGSRRSN